MSDYENYDENLAFPPQVSTDELARIIIQQNNQMNEAWDKNIQLHREMNKQQKQVSSQIKKLCKMLDLKSEYIERLENKEAILKEVLKECRKVIDGAFLVCSKEMCKKIDEVLK